ncbi:MAG: UvrD-helicase domain-containing protein [Chloroflexi bacterium]|nr:UvrD-helicase domain-containing protein [Chloroflexota bacterium]
MTVSSDVLQGLNPAQRQAVEHIQGPLLIVAGPGSGKTRVIAHRIAYLVRVCGVSPHHVCAVTFTNRAARELRERLDRLLGTRAQALTAGTFHAFCARVLRRDGVHIGLESDFNIYDDEDQRELLKRAMEELELDPRRFPPTAILSSISNAKSQLIDPEGYLARGRSYFDEIVQRVYQRYQELLARHKAVDFDDLLMRVVELFRRAPPVLHRYQERYVHLLIDEFQDTNVAQYHLARLLAGKYKNICVVGDPDQSIYSWRNADLRNILSFQKDYPDARMVNLDQNYRSTKTILDAARHLISVNKQRLDNNLWTQNTQGVPIVVAEAYTPEEEAQLVLQEVQELRQKGRRLRDCAVMYRVNAQSRAFEEACLRYGIAYKLVGGVRFYQRREVKDILAYLRVILNPYDEVSLLRIINTPTRGIGQRTVDDLARWARGLAIPLYAAIQAMADERERGTPPTHPLGSRQAQALLTFLHLLNGLMEASQSLTPVELLDLVVERTGYQKHLRESSDPQTEERLENVRELRAVAQEYPGSGADALRDLLENSALMTDQDTLDTDQEQDYLTLITLHQAKGLEFPVVFMAGMEDGLLPHIRSFDDPGQMEEERRLCYVGMTRAKERLYLTRAFRRNLMGATQAGLPSRFLQDIPSHLVAGLTRAAERAAPDRWDTPSSTTATAPSPPPFKAGEKVRHGAFGEGIVVSCAPSRGDFEVTVAFKGQAGVKRLLHSLAKLERT